MSELNYGVNVENLLHDLSQHESSDIGEFDVYGEDEQGREGCASIDITLLASDALKVIANLKSQHAALLGGLEEAIRHKDKLTDELNVLAAENAALKDTVALLLEDARRVLQVESNAGTESRVNTALSLLSRAGKDGE